MDLPLEEIKSIRFKRRKIPISPTMRPAYRICQIILILHISSVKQSASLLKLQLFNWCFQNDKRFSTLINLKETNNFPLINFDPFLNRALNLGVSKGYFDFFATTGKYTLTIKGEELAVGIIKENILEEEIILLNKLKKSLSDTYIQSSFKERFST
ncbi:hypothetical protein [Alkalihalobacillus pseudalcaliphilus]|uniref:hypothetical protein n=1 Tax=Alkalihalobacillus pseudalcaliphilus TaxID=79884 RepID=UPI00064DCDC2|nr:hypothetical protein [Alkalihalobacillus pseudalcaliphilus]KMK75270.1 hypothetical protein AB990_17780 [Alkalihalobacillus pseudalcaliphilus]